MRLLSLIALFVVLAQSAAAADALPKFRKDTPYPQVRAQMIKQGFEPARILKRSENSPLGCGQSELDMCKRWIEAISRISAASSSPGRRPGIAAKVPEMLGLGSRRVDCGADLGGGRAHGLAVVRAAIRLRHRRPSASQPFLNLVARNASGEIVVPSGHLQPLAAHALL